MVRDNGSKNRIDGLVAGSLKLQHCAIRPVHFAGNTLPAAAGRRIVNCGAAWSAAHTAMATNG